VLPIGDPNGLHVYLPSTVNGDYILNIFKQADPKFDLMLPSDFVNTLYDSCGTARRPQILEFFHPTLSNAWLIG
jgi:hypothetical protein